MRQGVLSRNDGFAAENRKRLAAHGTVALNLISSPGAGKTTLLERTLENLNPHARVGVLTGDIQTENDARRAVLCALGMQKAMGRVNEQNRQKGWPEIEMGIALHTGEVVVGNIGSVKRSKYGVVGRTINTTARIESFTVGGQSGAVVLKQCEA